MTPRTRREVLRWSALAGGSALSLGIVARSGIAAQASLPAAIAAIMAKPRYAGATWNLFVTDMESGEVLYELNADQLAFTGSVRKLFSTGLALRTLGVDHRITTPVYRRGEVGADGRLAGDLILVAAGDLTFGGRLTADGDIAYTAFDHNDANNLGTAILTPQDPLHGVESLARQVAASGIRGVSGDVIVDDRLFESFRVPNGNLLVTPIMVNENMVDVTFRPNLPGEEATYAWRPATSAFEITGTVVTGPAGSEDTVTLSGNGRVECIAEAGCTGAVTGSIPAGYRAPLSGSDTLVQTFRIENPAAFARTAFIDALQRAGVPVAAPAVGANPATRLPAAGSYGPDALVARFVSPPYWQDIRLILKVSLNLGANLSLMQFAQVFGARTIGAALATERQTLISRYGLAADSFDFPTNGSGSPDSRATPRAVVQLLGEMGRSDVAGYYRTGLPVLGVDGSLANTGVTLPGRGHVFAKTGTTITDGALKAQNLAGYIDARSGRRLAFALFVNDAGPIERIDDVSEVFEDEGAITSAIYELA